MVEFNISLLNVMVECYKNLVGFNKDFLKSEIVSYMVGNWVKFDN